MHLKTIKLAGFKSFVDPTTIQLRSPLTAVVGPNGCGKSNIVDAIRWVIGESSAKYLRAQDMSEVIFNGTASRKPLAQAAVELIFDNSDGSLGGEYASYAEISVRRVVERDGQSQYFLNNHRCRRRDITDIFMGTGLGPRSYAIIEQGMVTRLIDAKPEELAAYLKEVAGISKYEERRKETEQHIRHTRDNLNRASDICGDLSQQLERLQQQVEAAEKFRVLKEEGCLLKAQLQAMHWRSLEEQSQTHAATIADYEALLEQTQVEQKTLEATIEALRLQQRQQNAYNAELQNRDYQLGTEFTRLEQRIQYTRERHQQSDKDLAQLAHHIDALEQHIAQDRLQYAELETKIAVLIPKTDLAEEEAKQVLLQLQALEDKMRSYQLEWDQFVVAEAHTAKHVALKQHTIDTIEQRMAGLKLRQARFNREFSEIAVEELQQEIADLATSSDELESACKALQERGVGLQEQIHAQRTGLTGKIRVLRERQSHLQNLQGRLSSLETMQQAALGQDDQRVARCLESMNLHQQPRLVQKIQVEAGWELAVETALQTCLAAICTPDFHQFAETLSHGEALDIALFNTEMLQTEVSIKEHPQLGTPLLTKITSPWSLASLLSGIYVADTMADAIVRSPFLQANESIITREGLWLGDVWLKINRREKEQTGVLAREQALHELHSTMTALQEEMLCSEQALQQSQAGLQACEQAYHAAQQEFTVFASKRSDQQAQLVMKRSQLSHLQKRQADLQLELTEIAAQLRLDEEQMNAANHEVIAAQQKVTQDAALRLNLLQRQSEGQIQLETLRKQSSNAQETWQATHKALESMRQQLQFLLQNIARAEKQLSDLLTQRQSIQQADVESLNPLQDMEKRLADLTEQRSTLQATLGAASLQLTALDEQLSALTLQQRSSTDALNNLRIKLEPLQMERQAAVVRAASLQEQFAQANQDVAVLLQALPQSANEPLWQHRIERNQRKLDHLGPINLAALDEHKQLFERKQEMDVQQQDLIEALTTLEEAITKIDQETRVLFKETFEKVNQSFQTLFPKIFTGGVGSLALTEGDLFTAGVIVMVQPAGKRNSKIQSLSGGEKALTAITLIFALFQLNPAPFCILDEVDAPLDDQNVGRFCEIVKEISREVQFIVVTHNKLAMEMAEQLMGITMQEPGVSRTVAVDIAEAMAMVVV